VLPGSNNDRIQPKQNAVLFIGRSALLPQWFRHNAKHRAAIEEVKAVA